MADDGTPFDPDMADSANLGAADLPVKKRGPRYPFDPDPNEDPMTAQRKYGPTIAESTMFDPETFDRRWQTRGGAPALSATARMGAEKTEEEKDLRGVAGTPQNQWFDPQRGQAPDMAGRYEDERGMTGDELDLQARFERSRGMGIRPDYPIPEEHWSQNKGGYYAKDLPQAETPPMAYGMSDLPHHPMSEADAIHYNVQHNLKGQYGHNQTPLDDTNDMLRYLQWARAGGKNAGEEEKDYDLRGYYKAGGQLATPGGNPVHLPDTFKKPNHPTFSDESKYSGPGNEGGHWLTDKSGNYIGFQAGPANLYYHSPQDMQAYFDKYEPGI